MRVQCYTVAPELVDSVRLLRIAEEKFTQCMTFVCIKMKYPMGLKIGEMRRVNRALRKRKHFMLVRQIQALQKYITDKSEEGKPTWFLFWRNKKQESQTRLTSRPTDTGEDLCL